MNEKHANQYKILGRNIARYRKKAYLTQEGLALRANLSRGYLSQIEAEHVNKAPSLEMVFNIADALGIEVSKLFEEK